MSMFKEKSKAFKITVISVILAALVVLSLGSLFAYYAVKASTNNIYDGIRVGSVDIGGMSKNKALELLTQKYNAETLSVTVDCEGTIFDIYGSAFSLEIDHEATVEEALAYGKSGSVFSKIKAMRALNKKPLTLKLAITCDYDALQYAINENLGSKLQDVQEYTVEIGEDELIVTNGTNGRVVSAQKILDGISDAIVNDTLSEPIKVSIEVVKASSINADEFFKKYNRDAQDATVEQNGDEVIITPEVIGIKLDKNQVKSILAENKDSKSSYSIPAEIVYPDITAQDLEAEYTDTIIGTYSTNYATSSENRKTNIHLASDKINGLILNPGEVFSYNEVVGPRTRANGFKLAQSYSGSKVVEDVGGGICQVSSTLYNAVVFADLEIVYRINHSMPVSYTPLGRDATVSYGSIDFKIKNNKETPVKIEILYDGSTLTANIYGRKAYAKDISIETAITGSIPFSVTEIKDDTLYVGETKVEEAGSNGTTVESYKIVKENGEVVSRKLLAKSTYSPKSKVVRVGTKPKEESPETDESEPTPEPNAVPNTPQIIEPEVVTPQSDKPQATTPDVAVTAPEPLVPSEPFVNSAGQVG